MTAPLGIARMRSLLASGLGQLARLFAGHVPVRVYEVSNPAAASAAGLKAATASQVAPLTWSASDLIGAGLTELLLAPRTISFTTAGATPADAPANAVVTGLDVNGDVISETITVPQTATINTGSKCFSTITSVAFAAGDGTGATVSMGWGAAIGLPEKAKLRNAAVAALVEFTDGVPSATRGTYVVPATAAPNGSVSFNSAPNGSRDYTVYYERDVDL